MRILEGNLNLHTVRIKIKMSKQNEKRPYKQGYRQSWEKTPLLKDWIQGVPGKPDKAYCRYCKCMLYAHRYSVLKHTCTIKHQENIDKFKAKQIPQTKHDENLTKNTQVVDENQKMQNQKRNDQIVVMQKENYEILKRSTPKSIIIENSNENEIVINSDQSDEYLPESHMMKDDEANCLSDDINNEEHIDVKYQYDNEEQTLSPEPLLSKMSEKKRTISTHILDTSRGKAAANIAVTLYKLIDDNWKQLSQSITNTDGRCSELIPQDSFTPGCYKLHFDVYSYLKEASRNVFYPFIEIAFQCEEGEHYHVPLLLNPFGYSTYRGT